MSSLSEKERGIEKIQTADMEMNEEDLSHEEDIIITEKEADPASITYVESLVVYANGMKDERVPDSLIEKLNTGLQTGSISKTCSELVADSRKLSEEEINYYIDEDKSGVLKSYFLNEKENENTWYMVKLSGDMEDVVIKQYNKTEDIYKYYYFYRHVSEEKVNVAQAIPAFGVDDEHYFLKWEDKNYLAIPEWNKKENMIDGITVYTYDTGDYIGFFTHLKLDLDGNVSEMDYSYATLGFGTKQYSIYPDFLENQISAEEQSLTYVGAYTDYLIMTDFVESENEDFSFPVRGFILMDLNFDKVPELLVFHDSCGSMGGYFTYYYFDGKSVKAIVDSNNEPVRYSTYTKILADKENKKVYLLKEMYLLEGNENGKSGYLSDIIYENGIPCISNILYLEVNQEINLQKYLKKSYHNENDFLLDDELEPCLIKKYFNGREWIAITSGEYLQKKTELLSEENEYMNLHDASVEILWSCEEVVGTVEDDAQYRNRQVTKEEIDTLFSAWFESLNIETLHEGDYSEYLIDKDLD